MNTSLFRLLTNKNSVSTDDLYIALIGKIDAQIISSDLYINNGEYYSHYSAVIKNNNKYFDVFENKEYEFRNEEENETILKMYHYSKKDATANKKDLEETLVILNNQLENNKIKKGDKQRYVRIRKQLT